MNKTAINLGLIFGVIGIILFLLIAVLEPGFILLSAIGLVSFAIAIILPIVFIRKERTANGGVISFGDAFKLSFVGLIIGGVIGLAFQALYTSVIDPELGERMTASTLEMTNNFLEGNMSDAQREEILREAEADSLERWTFAGQLKSFGIALVLYAVVSLILAAVLKKTPEQAGETLDA